MENIFSLDFFNNFLFVMALVCVVIFVALYFVDAGYGKMRTEKWGPAINNKVGWCLMEAPVFVVVLFLWAQSEEKWNMPYLLFMLIFELHYFQRSFIFPCMLKGNSQMPIVIMGLSMLWNLINGYVQGYWLFHLAPAYAPYAADWISDPRFIIGAVIFFVGMGINLHSDHVIRHLRKPGDTNHYLPNGGLYKYVTSANYLGEITEWFGWAILTWSWAGALFLLLTCSNLVPRANSIYYRYKQEFAEEFEARRPKLKRIFPFIY